MLITPHFVFVHIPKTGGSFLRRVCERYLDSEWIVPNQVAKHGPDTEIPSQYQELPRFALVRNPWDWYVSWYHYLKGEGFDEEHRRRVTRQNPLWIKVSNNFENDFTTTLINLLERDPGELDIHPRSLVVQAREKDVDMLTVHYWNQVGESLDQHRIDIGRQEALRDDFLAFVDRHEVPVPEVLKDGLRTHRSVNASRRGNYRDYYEPALRDLVAHKSRHIVNEYGYTF